MEGQILDVEFFIYKAAFAFKKQLDIDSIHSILNNNGLSNEDCYLIIKSGKIIANDWDEVDSDDIPTNPGISR